MVKTLLISEIFPPKTGGSGRWFWEIYRRLPRKAIVIAAGQDPRQEHFDQTHDLHVVRLPLRLRSWGVCRLGSLYGYWRAFRRLGKVVASQRIGVAHCGRTLPEGLMALGLKRWYGVPYACYAHGEEMNYASTSRELSWLVRRVLHSADLVIANSRNTARLLQQGWNLSERQIEVLHPGVDTKRFVPAHRDASVRRELGWGNRPVVLTVGRLQRRKGHDLMIRALRKLTQAVPGILYAIVGEGEERPFLESLAVQEGIREHVQFLGEVAENQLVRCYQQCELFVLPNRQVGADIEGFGMVLLEAQACGKPVVAGLSGGTAETMSIPDTGYVIPCEEPHRLAALLVELMSNAAQLERMGGQAREWAVKHFDWTACTNRAARIFERLAPLSPLYPRTSQTLFIDSSSQSAR